MRKKTMCFFLASAVISLSFFGNLLSQNANAEELTAMLSNVSGKVEVIRTGEVRQIAAKDGMTLYIGDTVKTGHDGLADISFLPKTEIQLGNNAELGIDEHVIDERTSKLNAKLNLISGNLRAILKDLPKDSVFEVKTPTSVAAVRGTVYYIGSEGEIYVLEGSVTVTNLLTGGVFVVYEGQAATVHEDGSVEAPHTPAPGETGDLVTDFAPMEAEPYEPPERPGIVITPNAVDPFIEPASDF